MATKKPTTKSTVKPTTKKPAAKKTAATKAASKKPTATKKATKSLVDKYRTHKGDTGSTEVQIAQISEQINTLSKHLKSHHKDNDSRRGLLIMVGKRRRLLNYLARNDEQIYQKLIVDLKLRK